LTHAGIVGRVPKTSVRFLRRPAVRRILAAGVFATAFAVLTTAGSEIWVNARSHGHVYPEWRNSVVRERGAVVKAVVDVVSHRDPVFLGPHETTVEEALRVG
jgi:hypothetical protein